MGRQSRRAAARLRPRLALRRGCRACATGCWLLLPCHATDHLLCPPLKPPAAPAAPVRVRVRVWPRQTPSWPSPLPPPPAPPAPPLPRTRRPPTTQGLLHCLRACVRACLPECVCVRVCMCAVPARPPACRSYALCAPWPRWSGRAACRPSYRPWRRCACWRGSAALGLSSSSSSRTTPCVHGHGLGHGSTWARALRQGWHRCAMTCACVSVAQPARYAGNLLLPLSSPLPSPSPPPP